MAGGGGRGARPALRVEDFDFVLPPELIAQRPVAPRDAARMLEIGPAQSWDRRVADLPKLLRRGDLLVVNDTRVIKARLDGRRGDAAVEVTLHQLVDESTWRAFAKPAKKLRPDDAVAFAPDLAATVTEKGAGGEVTLRFAIGGAELRALLDRHGRMPLPPYIKRPKQGDPRDVEDYQTLFARRDGAVAAPTAALHFTPALTERLREAGIESVALTLHVGAGTFLPVKVADTRDHKMHAEYGEISAVAADTINAARARGATIIAVGTTVMRLLETAADAAGVVHPFAGETRLFISPGYRFRTADRLLTNFHLPRSTLFMLVCAYAGLERMRAAYAHAIHERYRFYSYGDCCLIHCAEPNA